MRKRWGDCWGCAPSWCGPAFLPDLREGRQHGGTTGAWGGEEAEDVPSQHCTKQLCRGGWWWHRAQRLLQHQRHLHGHGGPQALREDKGRC